MTPSSTPGAAGRPRDQRGPDHRGRISPPQQHRDRQQHVRDQARRTPGPAGPQQPDASDVTPAGPPPRAQHTWAGRARHAAGRQPGLDQILIRRYRDQRVPPCIRARPSRTCLPGHVGGRAVVQLPMLVTVPGTTTGLNSTTPRSAFLGSTDDEARLSDRHPERWSTAFATCLGGLGGLTALNRPKSPRPVATESSLSHTRWFSYCCGQRTTTTPARYSFRVPVARFRAFRMPASS